MALALDQFQKKVQATAQRKSDIFLRTYKDDGVSTFVVEYVNVGRVQDASLEYEPVAGDADQDGRETSFFLDATLSFTLKQGDNDTLSSLPQLSLPTAVNTYTSNLLYPNGHTIYATGQSIASVTVNANLDVNDLPTLSALNDLKGGMVFENLIFKPAPSIPLGGAETAIVLEGTFRIPVSALSSFDTNPYLNVSVL